MTLDTLRTPPIRTGTLQPTRTDPELLLLTSIIAQAVADYRWAVKSGMVSHFAPKRSHKVWTMPHQPTSRGDSCNFKQVYNNRKELRELLWFFQDGAGLDQWAELACLPITAASVRCQLDAEETGARRIPCDQVYLTIASKRAVDRPRHD